MGSRVLAVGTALPETVLAQDRARDIFLRQPGLSRLATRLTTAAFDASGIATRHTAHPAFATGEPSELFDADGLLLPATTGTRNALYAGLVPPLVRAAAVDALARAGVRPEEVTHVITVSCTGFFSPGPDLTLVRDLGLDPSTRRLHLGFMGCYGAFPALQAADAFCRADPDSVVLVVCVELCTLHVTSSEDPEQIVAMSVFGDGAAAAVVAARESERPSLVLDAFTSTVVPDSGSEMAWTIGDTGFRMRLSSYVPAIVGRSIREAVAPLLPSGAAAADAWAVHPGGRAILDRVEEALELPPEALAPSRAVLAEHGNMSSATVLFILRRLLDADTTGTVCALAFGPGLTVEGARMTALAGRR